MAEGEQVSPAFPLAYIPLESFPDLQTWWRSEWMESTLEGRMLVRSVDTIIECLDGFDCDHYEALYLTLCSRNELLSTYSTVLV
jgi:hypothetical protein